MLTEQSVRHTLAEDKELSKIRGALQRRIPLDAFIRMTIGSFLAVPKLRFCTAKSFYTAMMKAAELGLEPGSARNQGNILPFKNKSGVLEAVFIPQWHGLRDLAYRTKKVKSICAGVVHKGDVWELAQSYETAFHHVPVYDEIDGMPPRHERPIKLIYTAALMLNSGKYFAVKSAEEINKIRRHYSKQPDGPAWKDSWASMGIKTVAKEMFKLMPREEEFEPIREVIDIDNEAYFDMPESADSRPPIERPRAKQATPEEEANIGAARETLDSQPVPMPPEHERQMVDPETGEILSTGGEEGADEEPDAIKDLKTQCETYATSLKLDPKVWRRKVQDATALGVDALLALKDGWEIDWKGKAEVPAEAVKGGRK
jgi:phage RecT family recombinase